MTFHEIWSIIIPSAVGIGGILGGIWIGQHLSDRKEEKQKTDELEKIRYFLNADFSLVQRTLSTTWKVHKEWQDVLVTKNQSDLYMSNIDNLQKLLVNVHINTGYFSYWDFLIASGSLIKLNPDELRIIENAHKSIVEYRRIEDESADKLRERLVDIFTNTDLNQNMKRTIIKERFELYFSGMFKSYEYIQSRLKVLNNNISWINLKTEPIIELKGEPKMKIDSKGTYTIE